MDSSGDGSQTPFGEDSPFSGMDPNDVAQRFQVMEATLEAQREQIAELKGKGSGQPPARQTPIPDNSSAEEEEVSAADYWANPVKHQKKIVEGVVRQHLEEVITPFREDLARSRTSEARNQVRAEFPDFTTYEPLINQMLDRAGNTNPDIGQLRMLYYTAKGYSSSQQGKQGNPGQGGQGRQGGQGNNQQGNRQRPPSGAPPQHRASNQPLNDGGEGDKKPRQLTETERAGMKMFGFKDEAQYLAYLEADETEVANIGQGDD